MNFYGSFAGAAISRPLPKYIVIVMGSTGDRPKLPIRAADEPVTSLCGVRDSQSFLEGVCARTLSDRTKSR